ncbi:unnamed protein product [Rhizoctonia solani]|uniref:Uncharacterized protein n=1 Tax=Rhizoctonia solani TaxID=456999 RepID=A0A8H3DNB0_9AGAM|nr:unnamed protein product [Rhizoctonia solani]
MIVALRTGTAGNGVLEWIGQKAYGEEQFQIDSSASNLYDVALHSPESLLPAAAVEQVIEMLDAAQCREGEALWKGVVEWPNVVNVTLRVSCIALYFAQRSYQVSYRTDGERTEFE